MDDYSGLAARVAAGVGGLRGCLILSRDGLVLGAYPSDDDNVAKPSWLRFAMLGEPERSFVEFGDQVWVYVHRGPYAAFAIADPGVRPGLVMDELEQALMTAEQSRMKREGMRPPESSATPAGPRTTLHPTPSARPAPIVVPVAAEAVARTERSAPAPASPPTRPKASGSAGPQAEADQREAAPPAPPAPTAKRPPGREPPAPEAPTTERPKHEPPKLMTTPVSPNRGPGEEEEGGEVDRVMLAQEFSGLLQEFNPDDEDRS